MHYLAMYRAAKQTCVILVVWQIAPIIAGVNLYVKVNIVAATIDTYVV